MGIFNIIAVIPIVIICALLGIACLKLVKLPIILLSVSIFTSAGGVVGVIKIIVFGVMFSNSEGQLDSSAKILGMFIIAGVFSVMAGIYASSQYAKHKKTVNDRLRLDR